MLFMLLRSYSNVRSSSSVTPVHPIKLNVDVK